jgi:hypothetical protein
VHAALCDVHTALRDADVEVALPQGAVDESDNRWGDDFVVAWCKAVMLARPTGTTSGTSTVASSHWSSSRGGAYM